MTVRNSQSQTPREQGGQDWTLPAYYPEEEPVTKGFPRYATVFLVLLALAILCVTAFLLIRLLDPNTPSIIPSTGPGSATPTLAGPARTAAVTSGAAGQATIAVDPGEGYINTLVTASGAGWWPGEPVFIFLRSPEEGAGRGFSYAAAVADDAGKIRTAFTFPNEARWIGQPWAEVIGRGTRSNSEASIRFTLVPPTPTNTVPVPTYPPTNTPAPVTPTDTPGPTNTPTLTPTPSPTTLVITDWRGEYFTNRKLQGNPVLTRNDVEINFNWGQGSPASNIPMDGFSVRWTRSRQFRDGLYRFSLTADDGVRLWVDGTLLIDQWHDSGQATYTTDRSMTKGLHTLHIEYYEAVGLAVAKFDWYQISGATVTPTATPGPSPTSPVVINDWRGEYYANRGLQGDPVLIRDDGKVDFDWGQGSPAPGVPADGFSARWTRIRQFRDGLYRFTLKVDDGVRFWVDNTLVIDEWHDSEQTTYTADLSMAPGQHLLRIEYYDNVDRAVCQFDWYQVKD